MLKSINRIGLAKEVLRLAHFFRAGGHSASGETSRLNEMERFAAGRLTDPTGEPLGYIACCADPSISSGMIPLPMDLRMGDLGYAIAPPPPELQRTPEQFHARIYDHEGYLLFHAMIAPSFSQPGVTASGTLHFSTLRFGALEHPAPARMLGIKPGEMASMDIRISPANEQGDRTVTFGAIDVCPIRKDQAAALAYAAEIIRSKGQAPLRREPRPSFSISFHESLIWVDPFGPGSGGTSRAEIVATARRRHQAGKKPE